MVVTANKYYYIDSQGAAHMCMLAAWQGLENDSISSGNTRLLMIFVGIVALSMLIQAIVVIVVAIGAKRAQEKLTSLAESLHARAIPIIGSTEELIEDIKPKVKSISENLVETSKMVRSKAEELNLTLTDVNHKTKAQVSRIDGMISTALTATGSLAGMIHHGIKTPVVEAVGVVNGFKAGLDVLLGKKQTISSEPISKKTPYPVYKGSQTEL